MPVPSLGSGGITLWFLTPVRARRYPFLEVCAYGLVPPGARPLFALTLPFYFGEYSGRMCLLVGDGHMRRDRREEGEESGPRQKTH